MEIVPKRKWQYPISIEREYARLLTAYVDKELEIVEEFLPDMVDSVYRNSVHNDAIGDWLGNLVDRVQKKVKEKLTPLAAIRKTFQQVNKFVSTQMTETIKSLFGSKPRQFNNTRQFEMIQTIWTSQNLELVKSIDTQIMDKIRFMMSQRIIHAAEKPELKEQLTQEIQDLANVTRNRAALIAADQVGKLNSQLTQYRQMNMGIDSYMWLSQHDSRVRAKHRAPFRDGNIYSWNSPPPDGHPGWPIRCRCVAAPVFDTNKFLTQPRPNSFKNAEENVIIKEKLNKIMRETRVLGELAYPPPSYDLSEFSFDGNHINDERSHNVTEAEVKDFIRNAKFVIYRNDGNSVNFFSDNGSAYVRLDMKKIRTAFKREQFDPRYRKMLEVVEHETRKT